MRLKSHPVNVVKINIIDAGTGLTLIILLCYQYLIISSQGSEHLVSTNTTWHQSNRVRESVGLCDANDISLFAILGTKLEALIKKN